MAGRGTRDVRGNEVVQLSDTLSVLQQLCPCYNCTNIVAADMICRHLYLPVTEVLLYRRFPFPSLHPSSQITVLDFIRDFSMATSNSVVKPKKSYNVE